MSSRKQNWDWAKDKRKEPFLPLDVILNADQTPSPIIPRPTRKPKVHKAKRK